MPGVRRFEREPGSLRVFYSFTNFGRMGGQLARRFCEVRARRPVSHRRYAVEELQEVFYRANRKTVGN